MGNWRAKAYLYEKHAQMHVGQHVDKSSLLELVRTQPRMSYVARRGEQHGCDAMHRRHRDVLSNMLHLFYNQINSAPTLKCAGWGQQLLPLLVGSVDATCCSHNSARWASGSGADQAATASRGPTDVSSLGRRLQQLRQHGPAQWIAGQQGGAHGGGGSTVLQGAVARAAAANVQRVVAAVPRTSRGEKKNHAK